MNEIFDDFSDVLNNISIEREKTKFEITHLKLKHYYWNEEERNINMPISTSIELTCRYDFENNKLIWKKTISYTYQNLNNCYENQTNSYTEELYDSDKIINEIEKYDLRELKNNYFTDKEPNNFTYWELTYNNYFKIVGTYDQEIEAFKEISNILNFKKIIKEVPKKIEDELKQLEI